MNVNAITALCGVFIGCMSNMVFLEFLVKNDPGIGSFYTFMQFLFIALHGFVFTADFGTKKAVIPIRDYLLLVVMFFITNLLNNMAFDYNIPVPLHMIFRSGSLIANMIMGVWISKRSYSWAKYFSVTMITVGITICTLLSSKDDSNKSPDSLFYWVVGIILLTLALLISARMGIYQEYLNGTYGKNPLEAIYYTHLLSMPGFIFVYKDIGKYLLEPMPGPKYDFPIIGTLPLQWIYLFITVLTQYYCIKSVYTLLSECSSLTVTLVLTLRKFASIILSIIYFKNPFTLMHWFGTFLVFVGTVIFTEVPDKLLSSFQRTDKVKAN